MEYPRLIENSAKNYLFQTLKQCHNNRVNIYYYVFNIGIFIIFVSIVAGVLYYCHKTKISDYEKRRKMLYDQQYILSKIRFYQEENNDRKEHLSNITNLPMHNNFA